MEKLLRLPWLLLIIIGCIICLPLIIVAFVIEAIATPTDKNYYRRY
ncbi:hypothetical protein IIZ77_01295 [Candidatus Saccharibacteria bacterium]|nr:hypothetical protein [Candidatus Saccharibacteria bacterium]